MPKKSQFIGHGLTLPRIGRGRSQVITATVAPVLAALDDADTPAGKFTAGTYSALPNTISSQTAVYLVDGLPQAGSFDLTAGEVVQVREDVVDSAANERSFFTTMRVVDAYPILSTPEALPGSQTTATGLAVYTTSSTGTLHLGIYPAAATPTAAEIEAGTGAVVHDTKTITVDGRRTFLDQSGLTAGTSYKAWFVHRNEAGSLSAAIGSAAFSTHEATPVLSSATAVANGSDGATSLGVSTTIGNGVAYVAIYPDGTTPSASDVINGIGATAWGSKAVTTSGVQTFSNLTGLTEGTDYKAWFVQENVDEYQSNLIASAVFTTSLAVPVLSAPATTVNGQTTVTGIAVTTDTGSGTLNWGIYPAASTPSAADIVAGTGAVKFGSQAITASGAQAVADQSGLDAAEEYKTWFVQGLSTPVATALYYMWPDVIGADGELSFVVNDNGATVDLIVTVDSVEKFNGSVAIADYQADEFNLVAPVISGTAAVGQTLTRTAAGLWLYNTTSMNALTANWRKDTVDIPGETGTTYLTVSGDAGSNIDYAEDLGASTADSNDIAIPAASSFTVTHLVTGGDNVFHHTPWYALPTFVLTEPTYVVIAMGGQISDDAVTYLSDVQVGELGVGATSLTFEIGAAGGTEWSRTMVAYGTLPAGTYDYIQFFGNGSTYMRLSLSSRVYKVEGGAFVSLTAPASSSGWATDQLKTVSPTVAVGDELIVIAGAARSSGDGVGHFTASNCTEVYDSGTPGDAASSNAGSCFIGEATAVSAGAMAVGATMTAAATTGSVAAILLRAS